MNSEAELIIDAISDWKSNDGWEFADRESAWKFFFQAGAASRDAEIVSLTNQRDYEYVRAENAEHDRLLVKIAAKDAEIARLKTVPMKYRRMEFNAQLQNEVSVLEKERNQLRKDVAKLQEALHCKLTWKPS